MTTTGAREISLAITLAKEIYSTMTSDPEKHYGYLTRDVLTLQRSLESLDGIVQAQVQSGTARIPSLPAGAAAATSHPTADSDVDLEYLRLALCHYHQTLGDCKDLLVMRRPTKKSRADGSGP